MIFFFFFQINSKFNISNKPFQTTILKNPEYKLFVSGIEYTQPPSQHKFRDENKNKWMNDKGF